MAVAQTPDPLRLRPHGLEFNELRGLIEYLDRVQEYADASLEYFRDPGLGGFAHRVEEPGVGADRTSKASTATCIEFLRATGRLFSEGWDEQKRTKLRAHLVQDPWTSAELELDNTFTAGFLLEAIHALGDPATLTSAQAKKVDRQLKKMNKALVDAKGGLYVDEYPPTAFLTFKVVRALQRWDRLTIKATKHVIDWNWDHLYEESMLIASDSPDSDYFELAYATLVAARTAHLVQMTPRRRRILQRAVEQFFAGQRSDGTWPRSRPLFLYPNIGYAYCYDYELLVQLLTERQLRPFLYPHLDGLRKAAWALDARRVPLTKTAFGWSSEHHGGKSDAESWPTASVFHYCFELGRLVSDAVRRDVFEYVDATYKEPQRKAPKGGRLSGLMNSYFRHNGGRYSFKKRIDDHFLRPLVDQRASVRDGRTFAEDTKVSAIVYGPPGTSKTRLARLIADALGWPLLALDPSHLTRRGLDNVHAEADSLFSRLLFCDQIVVLLDEFDELVREREVAGELESRFLTTAMLPKIASLHERRRLVFIVATNHLEQFDAAISRPGRFDVIVPLMPPAAKDKFAEWTSLADARDVIGNAGAAIDVAAVVGDLTYEEAKELAARVTNESDVESLTRLVSRAKRAATLNQTVPEPRMHPPAPEDGDGDSQDDDSSPEPETWKDRIASQQSKIRGLGL